MRLFRKVSSNCLSNGLSLHGEVLSRYSSFGIARMFLRIAKRHGPVGVLGAKLLWWGRLSCPEWPCPVLCLSGREPPRQSCPPCTGYLCGNAFTTSWRVSPFVHCLVWRRITLPATVSWLATLDWDLCDPLSDVSALCHVRTARSAIDPSRRLDRVHGMSCRSIYATLLYRWLSSMHIWRPIYFLSRVGPRRICDIYDFFAPHINVLTYLLTYLLTRIKSLNVASVLISVKSSVMISHLSTLS